MHDFIAIKHDRYCLVNIKQLLTGFVKAFYTEYCCSEASALERRVSYLVDPASSHMLVSKIKPCMSKNIP